MKKSTKKTTETKKQSRKAKPGKTVKPETTARPEAETEREAAAAAKTSARQESTAVREAAKTRPAAEEASKGLKKQYLKNNPLCKVTFRLPREAAPEAEAVSVVGDFNNWDVSRTMMQKMKNGDFTATVELEREHEYKFRYLIDSRRWENDWKADKYVKNEYGSDDSVVVV